MIPGENCPNCGPSCKGTTDPAAEGQEPECCGTDMVHYPDVAWECAPSFFTLLDDEVIYDHGDSPPVLLPGAAHVYQDFLDHLKATRIPITT